MVSAESDRPGPPEPGVRRGSAKAKASRNRFGSEADSPTVSQVASTYGWSPWRSPVASVDLPVGYFLRKTGLFWAFLGSRFRGWIRTPSDTVSEPTCPLSNAIGKLSDINPDNGPASIGICPLDVNRTVRRWWLQQGHRFCLLNASSWGISQEPHGPVAANSNLLLWSAL